MATLLTSDPKSSDTRNNLLFKWCEKACGPGVAKVADSDNDLLKKILVCTIDGGGGGGDGAGDPVVDFEADVTSGFSPLEVNFTNLSVGDFVSYLWNFGDSSTSTDTNPAHTYEADGAYTVTLTGFTEDGEVVETKVEYITVGLTLFARYRSYLGIGIEAEAQVSTWEDQSGNGNHLVNVDIGPDWYDGIGVGGSPVVRFVEGQSIGLTGLDEHQTQMTIVMYLDGNEGTAVDKGGTLLELAEPEVSLNGMEIGMHENGWLVDAPEIAFHLGGAASADPKVLIVVLDGEDITVYYDGVDITNQIDPVQVFTFSRIFLRGPVGVEADWYGLDIYFGAATPEQAASLKTNIEAEF